MMRKKAYQQIIFAAIKLYKLYFSLFYFLEEISETHE